MADEQPFGTLWAFLVGRIVCHSCGTEIGVIHPSAHRPEQADA
jgi:hypothetical protein